MTIRYAVPDDVPALSAVDAECFPPAEAATAAEFAERVAHYADDGYTGTNFERPGFTRMIGCEPIRLDSYTQKKMTFSLIQVVCHWNCMNKKQRPHS